MRMEMGDVEGDEERGGTIHPGKWGVGWGSFVD